jgi:hypothetical protein
MQGDDFIGSWQDCQLNLPCCALLYEFLHARAEHGGIAVVLGNRVDEALDLAGDLLSPT